MGNPPTIWLDYRSVRIGWVIDQPDIEQVATAASWSTCLWGGRFNPMIPLHLPELCKKLIQAFAVDVLIPVVPSGAATTFIASHPHLQLSGWGDAIFSHHRCGFVDIRHAVEWLKKLAVRRGKGDVETFVRPTWSEDDYLSVLFGILFGRYPPSREIGIDYITGIRGSFTMSDRSIENGSGLPADFLGLIHPLVLSGLGLSWRGLRSSLPGAQIVLGDAQNFEDLILAWNLLADGAEVCFYGHNAAARVSPYVSEFLTATRNHPQPVQRHLTVSWTPDLGPLAKV